MTLIGHRSQNHPQQTARPGALDDVDDRRTPPELFDPLMEEFNFTLDAAATVENSKCAQFCPDGLVESWKGERVWCNPPYSNIAEWVGKAWHEMNNHGCHLVVMLLPANRTDQAWWQNLVEPFRDRVSDNRVRLTTRFLRGRESFDYPEGARPIRDNHPRFGGVLLIWTVALALSSTTGAGGGG